MVAARKVAATKPSPVQVLLDIPPSAQDVERLRAKWQRDIKAIADKIIEVANENGWCSTVETAMAEINPTLTYELKGRDVDGSTEFTEEYTISIRRTVPGKRPMGEDEDDFAEGVAEANENLWQKIERAITDAGIETIDSVDVNFQSHDDAEWNED